MAEVVAREVSGKRRLPPLPELGQFDVGSNEYATAGGAMSVQEEQEQRGSGLGYRWDSELS